MGSEWEACLPQSQSQLARLQSLGEALREEEHEIQYTPQAGMGRLGEPPSPRPAPSSVGPGRAAYLSRLVSHPVVLPTTTSLTNGESHSIEEDESEPLEPLEAASLAYVKVMEEHHGRFTGFRQNVTAALGCLEDIESRYLFVSKAAENLNKTCERLLSEQKALEKRKQLLAGPMEFFDELERLGPLLGMQPSPPSHRRAASWAGTGASTSSSSSSGAGSLSRAQPGSDEFLEVLQRIDNAIDFFQAHPQYRDSSAYLSKMRQLQARGLALIRNQVVNHLDSAARAAASQRSFENLETSYIYSRFRAQSNRVHDLVKVIASRAVEAPEHEELIADCKKNYTHRRWDLLKPVLRSHLEGLTKNGDSVSLARLGSSYLLRLCQLEAQLYDNFFGKNDDGSGSDDEVKAGPRERRGSLGHAPGNITRRKKESMLFSARRRAASNEFSDSGDVYELLFGLCLMLHELLRPLVIHEADLDNLCQLINVVKEEILEGQAPLRGPNALALEVVLDRIAKDAQERLIYSAQKVMRVDIELFKPTAADLNYPEKLEVYYQQKTSSQNQKHYTFSPTSSSSASNSPPRPGATLAAGAPPPSAQPPSTASSTAPISTATTRGRNSSRVDATGMLPVYSTWFPTLHITLTLLSKIYRAVEIHVFQDMAQQALSSCTQSLLGAASAIKEAKGDIDADLFLVKHLLILREQLVPFDIEFAGVERRLDFQSTRGALTKFFDETKKMFRMSADKALYSLALESIPTVFENEVDSKKQLEESLKQACNSFILHASNAMAEPLMTLLMKAQAFWQPSSSPTNSQAEVAKRERLVAQSFMQLDRLQSTLEEAHELLASTCPTLLSKMSLYLDNAVTRGILFKPVRIKVLHVVSQLRDLFHRVLDHDENEGGEGQSPFSQVDGLLSALKITLQKLEAAAEPGDVTPRGSLVPPLSPLKSVTISPLKEAARQAASSATTSGKAPASVGD